MKPKKNNKPPPPKKKKQLFFFLNPGFFQPWTYVTYMNVYGLQKKADLSMWTA